MSFVAQILTSPTPELVQVLSGRRLLADNDDVMTKATEEIVSAYVAAAVELVEKLAREGHFTLDLSRDAIQAASQQSYKQFASAMRWAVERYGLSGQEVHERFFPLVKPASFPVNETRAALLHQLPSSVKPAILTQGSKAWAATTIREGKLDRFFPEERIFTPDDWSEEYGFGHTKANSPIPFVFACKKMEWNAAKVAFADDTAPNLLYAKRLGMLPIWIAGSENPPEEKIKKATEAGAAFMVRDIDVVLWAKTGVSPEEALGRFRLSGGAKDHRLG